MPQLPSSSLTADCDMDISEALLNNNVRMHSPNPRRDQTSQQSQPTFDLEISDTDDSAFIACAQTASLISHARKLAKGGGGFPAMGLSPHLLRSIARHGFSFPTPIQRKTIPLLLDGRDVVGMARTGSGKTAAFLVPLIEKLKSHSAKFGTRAMVLSPSRELALQTLKVTKDLGRGTDLNIALLVGGDSLEEQFGLMTMNPDIVIATPGRLLHLVVEMRLDLKSVQYVVFDEADRLFEMGFAAQMTEILHALPESRQTMLFSATLPRLLVDFAKAGLREPQLVRLDLDNKISPDLQSAFFTMKDDEKDGALLHILCNIIRVPTGEMEDANPAKTVHGVHDKVSYKRKKPNKSTEKASPTSFSTLVFVQTKHHVEYLAALLQNLGFVVAYVYGSLDQEARQLAAQKFRTGKVHILIVTDVAARGIDFPVLANVVNYDTPSQPKIFIHRVGRTARAGQRGWSYSLVSESDLPYLLDLQLFIDKDLVMDPTDAVDYAKQLVLGSFIRDRLEDHCEWVSRLLEKDADLRGLRSVANKGGKLQLKTKAPASNESVRRSKDIIDSKKWLTIHPLFRDALDSQAIEREKALARISKLKPTQTIFEIDQKGPFRNAANIIIERRAIFKTGHLSKDLSRRAETSTSELVMSKEPPIELKSPTDTEPEFHSASESENLEVTISQPSKNVSTSTSHDPEYFMSYHPTTSKPLEDRAYSVHFGGGASFSSAARDATMDLVQDDGAQKATESRSKRWDKRQKKYVSQSNDHDGSKGARLIRGESGQKIPASFRSGRFEAWKKSNKMTRGMSRVGQLEKSDTAMPHAGTLGKRFKHKSYSVPRPPDKYRDDYHSKKRKIETAKELRVGSYRDGPGRSEIKRVDEVRKERQAKLKRREKTGRARRKL